MEFILEVIEVGYGEEFGWICPKKLKQDKHGGEMKKI